jgi:transposase
MVVKTSATKELVALRTGREVEPLLRELYLDRGYSDRQIADAIGVDRVTVTKWRREYGIRAEDRPGPLEAIA